MAYPPILRDANGNPIPICWDDTAQTWRPVRGGQYGQEVGLIDSTGKLVSPASEAKLEAVRALLEAIQSGDSADYGLLEILVGHVGGDLLNDLAGSKALLQSLDDFIQSFSSFVTLPKLESIEGKLGELETELATVKQQQVDGSSKVQLSGNMAELSSTQYSEVATTVKTYTCDGASRIEVFVESGRVRIRTDGQPCTAVTGEPLGEGFGAMWSCTSISVLYISDAVITVVSR